MFLPALNSLDAVSSLSHLLSAACLSLNLVITHDPLSTLPVALR